jgi:hypothetical protein
LRLFLTKACGWAILSVSALSPGSRASSSRAGRAAGAHLTRILGRQPSAAGRSRTTAGRAPALRGAVAAAHLYARMGGSLAWWTDKNVQMLREPGTPLFPSPQLPPDRLAAKQEWWVWCMARAEFARPSTGPWRHTVPHVVAHVTRHTPVLQTPLYCTHAPITEENPTDGNFANANSGGCSVICRRPCITQAQQAQSQV